LATALPAHATVASSFIPRIVLTFSLLAMKCLTDNQKEKDANHKDIHEKLRSQAEFEWPRTVRPDEDPTEDAAQVRHGLRQSVAGQPPLQQSPNAAAFVGFGHYVKDGADNDAGGAGTLEGSNITDVHWTFTADKMWARAVVVIDGWD
jgi:hypothetical protein